MLLGLLLSHVNVRPGSPLAFQGTADDARALLIGISGTMVTVIALLLGLAVVALQLSSTQFSPRLLRNFLRDRPNQVVLSVFVGTFAYAAAGLFKVGVSGGQRVDEFPRFAVTVAVVLLFVSLALLVFFADHLAHSIQVDHILRVVERSTLPVIRNLPPTAQLPAVPGHAVAVRRASRVTCSSSTSSNCSPRPWQSGSTCACGPGSGSTSWPARRWRGCGLRRRTMSESAAEALAGPSHAAVRIGFERTLEQDPGLGLRQLDRPGLQGAVAGGQRPVHRDPGDRAPVGALRARSPRRPIGPTRHPGRSGTITVAVPARPFAELLAIGVRPDPPLRGAGTDGDPGVAADADHGGDHRCARPRRGDRGATRGEPARRRPPNARCEPADLAVVYTEAETLRHALSAHPAETSPIQAAPGQQAAPPPT